jgi:Flp pilus assembly protein TadG
MGVSRINRIRTDRSGSATIEFALLAPVFFAALLGVVQAGWGFQNYTAMRQLSADVARYMIVNTAVSNTDVGTTFTTAASSAPYLLSSATVQVTDAATQRFPAAKEKTITVTAQVDSLFSWMGVKAPAMSYSQPVFVCASC